MNYNKNAILAAFAQPGEQNSRLAVLDLVDSCNLRCPECVRGSRTMKSSLHMMNLELYAKVCKKFVFEGVNHLLLYNWSEPFLHPDIDKFVSVGRKFNLCVSLSSNLSLPKIPTLIPTFKAGLDHLRVSVSGYTQETQKIYHRGSNLDIIREHLEEIIKHGYSSKVNLVFLDFGYNSAEASLWKKEAEKHGMGFLHEQASGDPKGVDRKQVYYTTVKSNSSVIIENGKEHIDYLPKKQLNAKKKICSLATIPTIDCYGKAYLCCDRPSTPLFCLGDYLDLSYEKMLAQVYLHPECSTCSIEKTITLSEDQCNAIAHAIFNEK